MGETLSPHCPQLDECSHAASDLLQGYGIRLRFVGARKMLPADLASTVSRMEEMTARNTKYVS